MICPCKTCDRQGCGRDHDTCEPYKAWKRERDLARTQRGEQVKIERYFKHQRYLRRFGKKDGT